MRRHNILLGFYASLDGKSEQHSLRISISMLIRNRICLPG